jgi:nucleoside-diphosphate-sugar epimerase
MDNKFKDKTILITGGAGFIGSHLCERFLGIGAKVVCFDNLSTGNKSNLKQVAHNNKFVLEKGDINNKKTLNRVFNKYNIDYVIHLAAVLGVKRLEEEPLEIIKDIRGTKYILDQCREHKIKKVIFASSSEAYGEPLKLPQKEDGIHNPNPRDVYALTKLMGENLIRIYYDNYKVPGCAVRFFNVYGPRQDSSPYGFVVGIFINQILKGEHPTIFGDGMQTRDFVYINDSVEAVVKALASSNKTNGEVINIGAGRQTTILDLCEKITQLSGRNVEPIFLPERKIEIRYRCPDTAKMQNLLKFKPRVSLTNGLEQTYKWYQNKLS